MSFFTALSTSSEAYYDVDRASAWQYRSERRPLRDDAVSANLPGVHELNLAQRAATVSEVALGRPETPGRDIQDDARRRRKSRPIEEYRGEHTPFAAYEREIGTPILIEVADRSEDVVKPGKS